MDGNSSLYDRLIGKSRPVWVSILIAAPLFLIAYITGVTQTGLPEFFTEGVWRGLFLPPTIFLYTLILSPILTQMERKLDREFRPLLAIDDVRYQELVAETAYIPIRKEIAVFAMGAVAGMIIGVLDPELTLTWYSIIPIIMTSFVFGLLAWVLYVTAAVGKPIKAFLDQPLRINLFDITPFEAIGKRSLIEALAFLGGVVLSLIFVLSQSNILLGASFWLVYIPLTLAPLAIFFFNMNPTHQVLAAEKEKQLSVVRAGLNTHSKQLLKTADGVADPSEAIALVSGLINYEQRLAATRTWPYNTGMLRTLFLSIVIPGIITGLLRIFLESLFR
jgi:hypothetical protein